MIKVIGAVLIIVGCGSVGFKTAAGYIREERMLRQIIGVLDFMECELQYRLTSLPVLCKQAAEHCSGSLHGLFLLLTEELEAQICPDVERCMSAALTKYKDLPSISKRILEQFGRSLGRFDLKGQLKGINDIRAECERNLDNIIQNKNVRLRSYRTLAICAGAALVILFI